nr:immunoglobulin light chain junction region [Macaca mulatta]MOV37650.1 immunoglobulin light chain junction region [Macaca mulatta]
CQQDSSFPLTF